MNKILLTANNFLKNGGFTYAICGGFALDLFANTDMRVHSDIDVCVFEQDKDSIYEYMKNDGWSVYEFHGSGIVRLINGIENLERSRRNLMCVKDDCELVEFFPCDKGSDYFLHEFGKDKGISKFNYVEFLFNKVKDNYFVFDNNDKTIRDMSEAILWRDNIPFLAPELVLLYKAREFERKWFHFDYENTIAEMDDERTTWFYNGLDTLYPDGHVWRK